MKRRRVVRWVLLGLLVAAITWIAMSSNPFAQGVRQLLGRKPDQPVLNNSFQVSAHSFRYYKFSLPEGSKHMALVGHFEVSAGDIEVYLLSELAFGRWQKGNAVPSIYQSGKQSEQTIQQTLPTGAGVYYVVFSNKSDPGSAKKVNARLALHSTNWLSY
jgi:hypothetical protein